MVSYHMVKHTHFYCARFGFATAVFTKGGNVHYVVTGAHIPNRRCENRCGHDVLYCFLQFWASFRFRRGPHTQ